MCWNAEFSLAGWIAGWATAFYIWNRNETHRDRWSAVFLFTFSSIQMCEFFLWSFTGDSMECNKTNRIVTTLMIPTIIALEPFSVIVGGIIVGKKFLKILLLPYFLWALVIWRMQYDGWICSSLTPQGYIFWSVFSNDIYYMILFAISFTFPLLMYMRPIIVPLTSIAYGTLALLCSYLFTDSLGSNWCLFSSILFVFHLVDPWLFHAHHRKPILALFCIFITSLLVITIFAIKLK